MATDAVTPDTLEGGFRELGIARGDRLMVHSSLGSFGKVDGGAQTVIDAVMNAVGPGGTILMPSFNHGAPFRDGGPGVFDPARTPTTNGAIPDRFWRMEDVERSLNATHAFAAWGRDADDLVREHHLATTMGPGSPLYRLWRAGGLVLLLGVGYRANTFHHVVETVTGAPCLGRRTEAYPVRVPDGTVEALRTWGWRDGTCPITDETRYKEPLRATGAVRQARIGEATCTLVPMQACYDVIARLLAHGLPPYPPCSGCPVRPRRVRWTVE